MYFVWEKNIRLSGQYAHFSEEPEGFELTDWISGKPLLKSPNLIRIKSDEGKSAKLTDLVLTSFNLQIFSPKLIRLLSELGVKNIEYYPVELVNHETDEIITSYKIANILGKIECLDAENSKCERFDDGELMSVEQFKIDLKKLEGKKGSHQPPKLFRLGEFPFIILAHKEVKELIEKEGITGGKFVEPSEYVGI
jgi:hypothetical protein